MRRVLKNFVLSAAFAASACLHVDAVPAYPGLIESVQPDGTVVSIRLRGDEHRNWAETVDGYTLMHDSQGYWAFARETDGGAVEASGIRYFNDSRAARAAGIAPGLRVALQKAMPAKAPDSSLQIDESFPVDGKRRLLMLLVNYSDTEPLFSQADFNDMMNAEGYNGIGSFRDYYLEASYGKLDIETTVTRWVTLPYPKSSYGSDGAVAIIRDALNLLDGEIDLKDFDNDGDGILDGLSVIHQGAGQEYTGSYYDIWSHSSTIYGMEFDGVQVRRYTIEPELLGTTGRMSTIGVVCHEFGHNLGAPDFYDTDYDQSGGDFPGTGVWDLMGSGAWNGDLGDRPAGTNMWQKIQLGWCEPIQLLESTDVTGMKSADKEPVAYRFDTTVPGEYFILENRQQSGVFDRALPGHGLVAYHVNEARIKQTIDLNTLNASYPQAMYMVCASAGCDPDSYPTSYGNLSRSDAPFPSSRGVDSFSDRTLPSTKSQDGRFSYKSLSNIAENADGEISFTFTLEDAPVAPVGLSATASRGVVKLAWSLPDGADAPAYFSVYRNSEIIATTPATSYVDDMITNETNITYSVDATYPDGLTSPYVSASVRIPANFVQGLSGEVVSGDGDESVALSWNVGTRLSRNTGMDSSEAVDYNTMALDYVHRFTAADLSIYKGYKIRRIGFMPFQGPRDISFVLRIWEADADGNNPVLVSERSISEFGAVTWNDLLLTKTVEIKDQKQLWMGVHCESSSGTIQIINDKSGNGAGLGNWIKIGDGEWGVDTEAEGNYYLRFTLVEPDVAGPVDMPDTGGEVDSSTDLSFPLGFTVYRDNELIGSTGNCRFVDSEPLEGTHTYSVSSCYKGFNESVPASVEVHVGQSGVEQAECSPATIIVANGNISLPGYDGSLFVADIYGRVIVDMANYRAGDSLSLMPGFYVVKTDSTATKLYVR